jgi:hypothetical protein
LNDSVVGQALAQVRQKDRALYLKKFEQCGFRFIKRTARFSVKALRANK